MEEEFLIERSVEPTQLYWPPECRLAREDNFVRGYRDIRGTSWEDASYILEMEQEILARVGGDLSAAEELVYDDEIDEFIEVGPFDVGVASAVSALSAAGGAVNV